MTTSRDAGDDLLRILDELDELIASARSMPMSASAIVNREAAQELIARARRSVPTAVHRAEEIVADADAVLAQGREESERLVTHAHQEAERLVAGENIVRMANDRADAIITAAEDKASALRHGADEYSDKALAALEGEVAKIAEQVRAGREVLAARLETWEGEPLSQPAVGEVQEPVRRRASWSVDPGPLR
ncbi:ATPase [Actinomyces bowdenii]|uniref:ATPase n=1 Tax=Actinomyces bowdenii TaxID=131109 RepID=A0A3P1V7L8_9ACTO|nr:ATPase [Actinomyces bowdenii]MBO3724477.1 ATPase [Actinomyces bowdenii]RRD29657.1 ATPase [Actinomyces bowdenii]